MRTGQLILIAGLYVSQSVPVSFLKTGFQVFLREQQIDYASVSRWMGLLLLPWTLKFLWAPLVDRFPLFGGGHRRSWILVMQSLGALVLAIAAFLPPEEYLNQLILLLLLYSFVCATQDIAVDGLTVLQLDRRQHGVGNSIQMGGYYLGELLGGAVILILFDWFGWTAGILALAVFFMIPVWPVLFFNEEKKAPEEPVKSAAEGKKEKGWNVIHSWVKQEEWAWLLLLFLYMGNQVLSKTLLPGFLSDTGMSKDKIGALIGIWGNAAGIGGAVLGGLLMNPLGRRNALLLFAALKLPSIWFISLVAQSDTSFAAQAGIIAVNDFTSGLATAALFTVMMDRCRRSHPGSDFTIQQSCNSIGILVFVILSGVIKEKFGIESLVYTSVFMGIVSLALILFGLSRNRLEGRAFGAHAADI